MSIYHTALKAHTAGLSLVPIQQANHTGDKKPAIAWKRLQEQPLNLTEINKWFKDEQYAIGVIMGQASKDLLMIELEGRAASHLPHLSQVAKDKGLDGLWAKLYNWVETTPSGGYHFYLHAPGNTNRNRKLAKNKNNEVLAETRENGGYSVIAPADGARFHHSGEGAWGVVNGDPSTAATVTLTELETLLDIFRTLNEETTQTQPQPLPTPTPNTTTTGIVQGVSPFDDYENKTSWDTILTPHGWEKLHTQNNETFWRRPGKTTGISACTGYANDRDRLYVWSTSTPFTPETPYTKPAAYTLLNHDGDYKKAAKHLHTQGYGTPTLHKRQTSEDTALDAFLQTLQNQPPQHKDPQFYTRTDDGNALRFSDTYQNRLRYIPERNTWAVWNGHQWQLANSNAPAVEAARHLARNLPEEDPADIKHKNRSLSKNAITAAITLAATHPTINTPLTMFDTNPYQLNTPTGVIDLKTGQQTPPDPNTLCLRSTTTPPKAQPTPTWDSFLAQTFAGTPELTQYLQHFLGMTLIGQVREQIFAFLNGTGANGKSTLLNVIQKILGTGETGYTTTIPANTFLKGAENRHPTEIAALQGVRLAITSETEEGQHFAEARLKLLTGADNISARYMGGNFFTFTPTHTIIMVSNHEPEVATGGDAFWRRVRKIPFNNTVPEHERDPELENKLLAEAPGILYWLIQGTIKYLKHGLLEPDVVRIATREYERNQDTVQMFIDEVCRLGDPNAQHMHTPVGRLRGAYEKWCRDNGLEPVSAKLLTQRLRVKGVMATKGTKGARFYSGVFIPESDDLDLNEALY